MPDNQLSDYQKFFLRDDFKLPTKEERLADLRQFSSSPPESAERKAAKDRLILASMRLIYKTFRSRLQRHDFASGAGQASPGSLFGSVQVAMMEEFSELAYKADEGRCSLSTLVISRASARLIDKIKSAMAAKRLPPPHEREDPAMLSGQSEDVNIALFMDEVRDALVLLDDDPTALAVMLAVHYSEESPQGLDVNEVADTLGIAPRRAKDAYKRAKEKLSRHYRVSAT